MGFGLAVVPKVMDTIIKWLIRGFTDVDNYVGNLRVPEQIEEEVQAKLARYGLPTKPSERFSEAWVLGLQLETKPDGDVSWRRRDGSALDLPITPTKRDIF